MGERMGIVTMVVVKVLLRFNSMLEIFVKSYIAKSQAHNPAYNHPFTMDDSIRST